MARISNPSPARIQGNNSIRLMVLTSGFGWRSSQRLGSCVAMGELEIFLSLSVRGISNLIYLDSSCAVMAIRVFISFSNFPIKVIPWSPLRLLSVWYTSDMFPPKFASRFWRYVG